MKRLVIAALLLLVPVFGFADTIMWTAPVADTDGTEISAGDIAQIKYHLYVDGVEFAVVPDGVTRWDGTLPQKPGEVKSYTCTAELYERESAHSTPTLFAYYLSTVAPGSVVIQLK